MNLVRDGTPAPPLDDGVEQQLATAVCVLLPPVQLIVDGERDTLLEATLGVVRPADDVTTELQTKRHVEVLGHVGLGPDLLDAILVHECSILKCAPPEEGVVTDEGSDLTVGASWETPVS